MTAREAGADVVVRVTSDCPLIDPEVVDSVVDALSSDLAYSSNIVPDRTFPRGLDTEAFRSAALEAAWTEARQPAEREHVTPFIWQQSERFPRATVTARSDYSAHRWTVDTDEDYDLVRRIYGHFGGDTFGWREVLDLIDENPDWRALNAHIEQKAL
jgi:spore coat polysaccharide biosynthesis protein SpsF